MHEESTLSSRYGNMAYAEIDIILFDQGSSCIRWACLGFCCVGSEVKF